MVSEFHAKKFMEVLKEKSMDEQDPISEWTLLDKTGNYETTCICEKEITKVFYIENKHTKKILEIGCDCAERWLSCKLECSKCLTPLGNVMQRIRQQNFFCRSCRRFIEKQDKYQFRKFKKYYGRPWKEVREDEGYVNWLANLDTKDDYLLKFLEYCKNFYTFE